MTQPPGDSRGDNLGYASPDTPDDHRRRSAGRWIILLCAWAVGLVVWGVYFVMFVYFVFKFL